MESAIEKVLKVVGSQSELARLVGVKPQAVQQWVATGKVPPRRVIAVVRATGNRVTPHELAPDIYPEQAA